VHQLERVEDELGRPGAGVGWRRDTPASVGELLGEVGRDGWNLGHGLPRHRDLVAVSVGRVLSKRIEHLPAAVDHDDQPMPERIRVTLELEVDGPPERAAEILLAAIKGAQGRLKG
jgi:hypothetical protein